jgi:2-polyprenyl-6-methoxyphenol hydroxylase-like FAD-dependent oxidoreductase
MDGSSYEGDIVVGADGVRSVTRNSMLSSPELAASGAVTQPVDPFLPNGFKSTYKCIFGCSPRVAGLEAGELVETYDGKLMWQLLIADDSVCWFMYIRMDSSTTEWHRYTDDDMHKIAETYLDHPISQDGGVKFRDIWVPRKRAKLADLEEGVMEKWYSGRIVLVGDAAHKMTSNLGIGANNAIESVASLVNHLHGLLQKPARPEISALEEAFASYQRQRFHRSSWCTTYSGAFLRQAGLLNKVIRFFTLFMTIPPDDRLVADSVLSWIPRDGLVFDFLPEPNHKTGRIPWTIPATPTDGN